ncbi:hypothetical protein CEP88_19010 [Roseobacter denitrificans]|nr:hypothetical protein CEP88_19010 [Roseobacter denitrificans]
MLFQNANDLLFAETASLHRLSPQLENRLTKIRGLFRGAGHATTPGIFLASSESDFSPISSRTCSVINCRTFLSKCASTASKKLSVSGA